MLTVYLRGIDWMLQMNNGKLDRNEWMEHIEPVKTVNDFSAKLDIVI